jgi:site-specific DNA-methyltransferase (adenine-specific)
MPEITLLRGDCLEIMPTLPAQSVDAIITDIPYGTTACKWDTIIPFPDLWRVVKRVLKPKGVFVTTASQPFTSALVMSNPDWFKYEWIWGKSKCGSPLAAKFRPMAKHENVLVFGDSGSFYNPEMLEGEPYKRDFTPTQLNNHKMGIKGAKSENKGTRYPDTILFFQQKWRRQDQIHPTQKPVALYEYLIRTYANEGDTVLDMCMGSGTTGVACVNTNRNFIGIEKDEGYFSIAEKRTKEAQAQLTLSL